MVIRTLRKDYDKLKDDFEKALGHSNVVLKFPDKNYRLLQGVTRIDIPNSIFEQHFKNMFDFMQKSQKLR